MRPASSNTVGSRTGADHRPDAYSVEEGGYHWRGELRLWDREVLVGEKTAESPTRNPPLAESLTPIMTPYPLNVAA
jgi:hypothetical protein